MIIQMSQLITTMEELSLLVQRLSSLFLLRIALSVKSKTSKLGEFSTLLRLLLNISIIGALLKRIMPSLEVL